MQGTVGRGQLLLAALVGLSAAGCQEDGPGIEGAGAAVGRDMIDEVGRRWEPVPTPAVRTFALTESFKPRALPGPMIDEDKLSIEQLAARVQPYVLTGAGAYRLSQADSLALARQLRTAPRRTEGPSGRVSPRAAPTEVERVSSKIIKDGESRLNNNVAAHLWPYNMVAAMFTTNPECTCFKMLNDHTCVTAAHCLWHANTFIASNIQFQAGSESPRPTIQGGQGQCWAGFVPGCWANGQDYNCDYGVIAFRGRNGAHCTLGDYTNGWFGWQQMRTGDCCQDGWSVNYPGEQYPATWSYPTQSYEWRSSSVNSNGSLGTQFLWTTLDLTGGASGGPINRPSVNDPRAVGIVWASINQTNYATKLTSARVNWLSSVAGF